MLCTLPSDKRTAASQSCGGGAESGPGRIRTCDRPVMLPSYSFRCPLRVCGLDCLFTPRLRGPAVQSLHLPQVTGLGSGLPCPMTKAPPNLTGFRLVITLQTAQTVQIRDPRLAALSRLLSPLSYRPC
mgnify:FL=1